MTVPILDKVNLCHSFPGPRESVACASSDAFVQPVDLQPVESRSSTPNVNWDMKSGSSPSGSKRQSHQIWFRRRVQNHKYECFSLSSLERPPRTIPGNTTRVAGNLHAFQVFVSLLFFDLLYQLWIRNGSSVLKRHSR